MVNPHLKGDTRTDFLQKPVVKEASATDLSQKLVVKQASAISMHLSCAATKRKAMTDQDDTVADFILGLVNQAANLPANIGNPPAHENKQHKRAKAIHNPEDQALAKFDLPKSEKVPIIDMILRWSPQTNHNQKEYKVRILLDTGSTVPLLDRSWAEALQVPLIRRPFPKLIENFAGQEVPGAGEYYTAPLELQHRKHLTSEAFEVAPLGSEFDAILPAGWTQLHVPTGLFSKNWKDLKFISDNCRKHCTRDSRIPFESDPNEDIVGTARRACTAPTESELQEAIDQVPEHFCEFIPIMTTEAASILRKHGPYDHAIELKEGSMPPWGPIYPLNEMKLEELRKWLKKMTDMGAV